MASLSRSDNAFSSGILATGIKYQPTQFWSVENPGATCTLTSLPWRYDLEHTLNVVSGQLVACEVQYRLHCYYCSTYVQGNWTELASECNWSDSTKRSTLTSAVYDGRLLLIREQDPIFIDNDDYYYNTTTTWIPLDGSPPQQVPFHKRRGYHHCTIQVSPDTIVVTGGTDDDYPGESGSYPGNGNVEIFVTEYKLTDGTWSFVPKLPKPLWKHACGSYRDQDGHRVGHRPIHIS